MKIDRTKLKKSSSEVVSTNVSVMNVVWLLLVLVVMSLSAVKCLHIYLLYSVYAMDTFLKGLWNLTCMLSTLNEEKGHVRLHVLYVYNVASVSPLHCLLPSARRLWLVDRKAPKLQQ